MKSNTSKKERSSSQILLDDDFPLDTEAGPGSYEIPNLFGKESVRYHNSPQITFSKAKSTDKLYYGRQLTKQLKGSQSPGSSAYFPDIKSVAKSEGSTKFPKSKRKFDFLNILMDRSPGPIYNYPHSLSTSIAFPKATRDKPNNNEAPPPGSYNPKYFPNSSGFAFKKPEKVLKGRFESFMQLTDTPGPAEYKVSAKPKQRGGIFSKVGRDAYEKYNLSPGPGSYDSDFKDYKRKTLVESFGKERRNIDIRNYAKSYEIYKSA
ncbi:unnamed protein product [Blepharisma stoltei]|uniref:Uncharacterized protein n=1 Tax=Blepharisma stoltei TaxID=1481888 RepID=A0AAU9K4H8_9CILI|nr:unnamed protein product [Blepharisma stoltei]